MPLSHIAVVALAWIIAATWIHKLIEASLGLRRVPNLWNHEFNAIPEGVPRIAVIVPARNEEVNIEPCIRSLLVQDYPALYIIAVDDRSEDNTGKILDELRSHDRTNRLDVLHIRELPAGWMGKTHAMALAADSAIENHRPEFLLFTDADVLFAPQALRRTVVAAMRQHSDHFVNLPTTLARTPGEATLLSYLQVIAMFAVRTWKTADPRSKRDAIGVGAFNMLRTEVYRELGGFEALRMEVLEDLTLGRVVKAAGYRQNAAISPGMVSVHWAAGTLGIVRGLTKNFFAVFEYSILLVVAIILFAAVLSLGPVVLVAFPETRIPALLAWLGIFGLYTVSSRFSRLPSWCAAFMPCAAGLILYAIIRSAVVTVANGGVTWRGTFYSLPELRRHRKFHAIRPRQNR